MPRRCYFGAVVIIHFYFNGHVVFMPQQNTLKRRCFVCDEFFVNLQAVF